MIRQCLCGNLCIIRSFVLQMAVIQFGALQREFYIVEIGTWNIIVRVFSDGLVAFLYFDICHYQKWQISKYGKDT